MRQYGPVQGKTLLVTGGAGAVGHYAVQLATWAGARVIATVSSPEKAERARAGGAAHVINYRQEDVAARVLDITGGVGVDHIAEVDFGGNLAAALRCGDIVQGLYDALLSTMKNGRTLGQSGRFTQLEPVILRSFDISSMARLAVGPYWSGLTEAQRRQVTESFGRYISAIYADRFDSYAGQKLEVTSEQPAPSGVMVKSQIIKASGEPVMVDYMMRRSGDGWLVCDIYLDGAISEVATPVPNSPPSSRMTA